MPRNKRSLTLSQANTLYDDIVSKGGNPLIVSRPKGRDKDDGTINIHKPLDEIVVTNNKPKMQLAGVPVQLDNNITNQTKVSTGELFSDIAKFADPTGILSWGDVYDSWKEAKDLPGYSSAILETLGALPVIGKVGKLTKLNKFAKYINSVSKPSRMLIKAPKVLGDIDMKFNDGDILKPLAYDVATNLSEGDASGLVPFFNFIRRQQGAKIPKYTGIFNPSKMGDYEQLISTDPVANVNALRLYGDDKGFEKYNGPNLVINGKELNGNYYSYPIYLKDKITLSKTAKDNIPDNKIFRIGMLGDIDKYNLDKNLLDIQRGSIVFKDNKTKAKLFDYIDNGGPLGKIMNFVSRPTDKYPNAGNPIFVQELPVEEGETDDELKTISYGDLYKKVIKKYGGKIYLD